ncbi:substrate-binding periplasmic protein [Aeromonas australiensis]|uniref:substrate-binding periplasmic protein n=1 Tax=Aeromonas australiensis TaxID=1114880 RepID=UPI001F23C8B0|nr:ABC transporter substrate-binding protein [Aeromonas australiensis]
MKNRVLLAGLLLSFSWQVVAKQQVVLVGDDDYPPYSYKDPTGKAAGLYSDLLLKVSAAMPDFVIELQAAPWKRALDDAEQGRVMGVYPPYKREALRPWMHYSDPLLVETVVVVCRKEVAANYQGASWPDGFAGLKFGNNAGFQTPGDRFFAMVKEGKVTLDEAKTTEQNLQKLVGGRIDCYPNDRRAISSEIARLEMDPGDVVESAIIGQEMGYIGFTSVRQDYAYMDDFIKAFNETLTRLRAAGEIPPLE